MKFFHFNQKIFAGLGITSNCSVQRFNDLKTAIALVMYGLGSISSGLFIFREATTFSEFNEATYICSAVSLIGTAYACIKTKTSTLFKFIVAYENSFEISERVGCVQCLLFKHICV